MRKSGKPRGLHPLPHFLTFCVEEPRDCVWRRPVWINRKLAPSSALSPYLFHASESCLSKSHFLPRRCYRRYARIYCECPHSDTDISPCDWIQPAAPFSDSTSTPGRIINFRASAWSADQKCDVSLLRRTAGRSLDNSSPRKQTFATRIRKCSNELWHPCVSPNAQTCTNTRDPSRNAGDDDASTASWYLQRSIADTIA